MLRSKCCDAEVLVVMAPDFLGDDVKTMTIGTCYYKCGKCEEACDTKEE
mgnify:CR=1 FL=1